MSSSAATVTATINPHWTTATYHVEYGPTTQYGSQTTETSAGNGSLPQDVAVSLSGLSQGTTYHYRVVATDSFGTAYGADQSVTTLRLSDTFSASIATAGASSSYTFTPGASGPATIGTCAVYPTTNNYDLYVYNSAGTVLASGTSSSNCEWVSLNVSAGQTYTVKTVATAGTGLYRSAWSVNGAPVTWQASGTISTVGWDSNFTFPILSTTGPISLSTCGPTGTNFDLSLTDTSDIKLAGAATPDTCEKLSYTPSTRGLYRLKEVATSGTGTWSGTVTTY